MINSATGFSLSDFTLLSEAMSLSSALVCLEPAFLSGKVSWTSKVDAPVLHAISLVANGKAKIYIIGYLITLYLSFQYIFFSHNIASCVLIHQTSSYKAVTALSSFHRVVTTFTLMTSLPSCSSTILVHV